MLIAYPEAPASARSLHFTVVMKQHFSVKRAARQLPTTLCIACTYSDQLAVQGSNRRDPRAWAVAELRGTLDEGCLDAVQGVSGLFVIVTELELSEKAMR